MQSSRVVPIMGVVVTYSRADADPLDVFGAPPWPRSRFTRLSVWPSRGTGLGFGRPTHWPRSQRVSTFEQQCSGTQHHRS